MSRSPSDRLGAWRRVADPVLLVAAILFLPAYGIPIIWPDADAALVVVCEAVMWTAWGLFALDLIVRTCLAHDRLRYLREHWIDVLVVVLPLLRPLRVLRFLSVARILDARATARFQGRLVAYVVGGALLLATVGALAVLEAERGAPGANIATFEEALWWAFTTMSTTGYGDFSPVTTIGRAVGVGLMVGGIAILGSVAGALASWVVRRVRDEEQELLEEERRMLGRERRLLRAERQRLQAEVDDLGSQLAGLRYEFDAEGEAGSEPQTALWPAEAARPARTRRGDEAGGAALARAFEDADDDSPEGATPENDGLRSRLL